MTWEILGSVIASLEWQTVGVSHAPAFRLSYTVPTGNLNASCLRGYLRQCWDPLTCDADWRPLYPKAIAETYTLELPLFIKPGSLREIQIKRAYRSYDRWPWTAHVEHWIAAEGEGQVLDGGFYADSQILDGGIYGG